MKSSRSLFFLQKRQNVPHKIAWSRPGTIGLGGLRIAKVANFFPVKFFPVDFFHRRIFPHPCRCLLPSAYGVGCAWGIPIVSGVCAGARHSLQCPASSNGIVCAGLIAQKDQKGGIGSGKPEGAGQGKLQANAGPKRPWW